VSSPGGPDLTSNTTACSFISNINARDNIVMHGFILVPAAGPYVQQRSVRGHCIILHRACL
jgi:hypothetical protein